MRELSELYMPEDYSHGHGIKREDGHYFETRDFTINELIAGADGIYCTKQCLLDTVRGIVRISDYEIEDSEDEDGEEGYYINPKLLAKALRFAAARYMQIGNPEDYEYFQIDAFHMALHLDRALEDGHEVAQRYVDNLQEHQQLPPDVVTPKDLHEYLEPRIYNFVFRFADRLSLEEEEELVAQDLDLALQILDELPQRESFSKPSQR
jgi:hypothetical protein